MLKDMDSLLHEVRDKRTRPLVAEVIKAYDAGALRAAIVSLWIAVVADLTFKIRFLAESGDGVAREAIKKLDDSIANSRVRNVQDYEQRLLRLVGEQLEMLNKREVKEMERLNEDRNLCAHPGFIAEGELFSPGAEIVRAHLVAAVTAVFSQAPLSGKRLLETLEREISGKAWPNGTRDSLSNYLQERYFRNARDAVKRNMLKILIKKSIRVNGASALIADRCADAVQAVADDFPGEHSQALEEVLTSWEKAGSFADEELIRAVGAFGSSMRFWDALPETAAFRLDTLLSQSELQFLIDHAFFRSGEMVGERFQEHFLKKVETLGQEQLADVLRGTKTVHNFVPRVLELVRNSANFRVAEGNLRLLEIVAASLSAENIKQLEVAIQKHHEPYGINQIRMATHTEAILLSVFEGCPDSAEHREAWRSLAKWLRDQRTSDDDSYRYDDLCAQVGVE